jgi:hypothetical protein
MNQSYIYQAQFEPASLNGGADHATVYDVTENGGSGHKFYPYDVLKNSSKLPANVDPAHKEVPVHNISAHPGPY